MLRTLLFLLVLPLAVHAGPVIQRGINLGNMLEVPPTAHWDVELKPGYLTIIHQAGFDTVRVPMDWADHAGPAPDYAIDPEFFRHVDSVVQEATASGLNVIVDYHYDFELMKEPDARADRFVSLWRQIAEHEQRQPDTVLFELLNEPCRKLDSARWNALIPRALAVIRPTNPTRTIIVGPTQWNSFDKLPELRLPENDQHLLVTFHYYLPMQFTHQGASWIPDSTPWLGTKWNGTDAEKAVVTHDFNAAATWAKDHHRPLFMGEFGSFHNGDMDSRARWTTCCARTAESLGIGWSYWEFCAGFGAYDPQAKAWRPPSSKLSSRPPNKHWWIHR